MPRRTRALPAFERPFSRRLRPLSSGETSCPFPAGSNPGKGVAPDGLAWSLRHRRRAMEQSTRFIGMDVHKDTIVVAVTATGDIGKATAYGTFPNTAAALEKLVRRLRQAGDGPLKFCYEAGPCGYGVHRTLTKLLGYAHISCRVRIGIRKRLRAYDAVRFGSLRQPEDTNRNGLVAWIIRGCPAR